MMKLDCFKTYDVRGRVDDMLDQDVAYRMGRALVYVMNATKVVVGRDARESSPLFLTALSDGLRDAGADVLDVGLCGTEEVYFATDHFDASAGVMVTASHNPIEYNGFKIVGPGAAPLSAEAFSEIGRRTASGDFGTKVPSPGSHENVFPRRAYVERVCGFVDAKAIGPVHLVANAGNGAAGPTFDAVIEELVARGADIRVTRLHHQPDASFPNGIPNPLLPENQPVTSQAVFNANADLGVAWDGDFDRCFFFDEKGAFIAGEFVVGLLAEAILERAPGARIVYDPRVVWNTERIVREKGGEAIKSKTGHVLVKETMRASDAIYGGEMSAHHYFRDFMFCDSGMIPWLLMLERLSQSGQTLSSLVADMRDRHPSSGEINFRVASADAVTERLRESYGPAAIRIDGLDGLSMEFADWRFNVRASNTEPLLRLNVESLGNQALLKRRISEVAKAISNAA